MQSIDLALLAWNGQEARSRRTLGRRADVCLALPSTKALPAMMKKCRPNPIHSQSGRGILCNSVCATAPSATGLGDIMFLFRTIAVVGSRQVMRKSCRRAVDEDRAPIKGVEQVQKVITLGMRCKWPTVNARQG